LVTFKAFRGLLFPKPETVQELLFAGSCSNKKKGRTLLSAIAYTMALWVIEFSRKVFA
jgi:hypothetical protein